LALQGRSGSFKVDDFGTNRRHVYDFLLIRHLRYGDLLAKNCLFCYIFLTPLAFGTLAAYVLFGILWGNGIWIAQVLLTGQNRAVNIGLQCTIKRGKMKKRTQHNMWELQKLHSVISPFR